MNNKLLLSLIFFLLFFEAFSQFNESKKIYLKWEAPKEFQKNENHTIISSYIENQSINFEKEIPSFSINWKVEPNIDVANYEISNIIFENILLSEFKDINLNNIPSEITSEFQFITDREENYAVFSIIPLIKQQNTIKKIISFEINYNIKPDIFLNKRATSSTSVLSSGEWYKIQIDATGVFKIDQNFLKNLGINTNNINPKNIQVYGNGGALLPYRIGDFRYDDLAENAIYIEGESDEKFDTNDFILFYAKGPESWKHNNNASSLKHVRNIYSDHAYYFIHIGNALGKRIENQTIIEGTPIETYQIFDDYLVYEKDEINLIDTGQLWFGDSFFVNNQKTFTFDFSHADYNYPIRINTLFGGISTIQTNFQVAVNGQNLYTLTLGVISDTAPAATTSGSGSTTINSDNVNVQITYNNNGYTAAKSYLDYIEIIGKKKLIAGDKQFSFRNFDAKNQSGNIAYKIQNPGSIYSVWNVTDFINPKKITNQGSGNLFDFNAVGGTLQEYIVLNAQNFYTPIKPNDFNVANQNLHGLTDVDYLIVTQPEFMSNAETLAQYHRAHNGFKVEIVPLYQIYNEFGSGSADITAIRDFVRHVYLQSNNHLRYLLLYGDASFDFKGIDTDKGIVPTFQSKESTNMATSFCTDDFFGIVSDVNEGDLDAASSIQLIDVSTGRIPFNNATEANQINNKILNYNNAASFGDYRNEVLLIADDADNPNGSDNSLQVTQEHIADVVTTNIPQVNVKKLWADAYQQEVGASGSIYPEPINIINNSIEKGKLLINYFGHGGEAGLSAEKLVTTNQINNWNNLNNLNTFIVISCEFARFDNPKRPNTAGEAVIRNPNGGAVHQIATTRDIYIGTGSTLNKELIPILLERYQNNYSISEHLRVVKNLNYSEKQRFFVYSFGDPALKLALPKKNIKLTEMNGKPITQPTDTIKALSKINFKGIITDSNDVINPNFNGEVFLTVYDKPQDKQTLSNDGIAPIMTFDTQDSKLFRGRATVVNGQFQIEFIAPKDIRIAYGKGKLSLYAENDLIEKGGYNKDIVVGGINYDAPEDNVGPQIKLYMNDTSFIDGGNTNQSPVLLAFFDDENGINTSFSAVDHDITAVLDNDHQNPIILNEYYITDVNNYTKGTLEFKLRDLSVGHHTLELKAYDTYNNIGNASINFVVVDDAKLILEHVLNYPNPFVNYTEFWFNHNKPNELLNVQIQIFTVTGKLVKTFNQNIQNTGSISREIRWNGIDDFGQKIGKGVYIYKLQVKTQNNLKAEKIEKLVILQ